MNEPDYLHMCRAKIHRATVTESNLEYEGSITIDDALIEASGLLEYEKVQVLNVSTGSRIETYVIRGKRDSGVICLNGAAARLGAVGDKIIIIAYAMMPHDEAKSFKPRIVHVDNRNKIIND